MEIVALSIWNKLNKGLSRCSWQNSSWMTGEGWNQWFLLHQLHPALPVPQCASYTARPLHPGDKFCILDKQFPSQFWEEWPSPGRLERQGSHVAYLLKMSYKMTPGRRMEILSMPIAGKDYPLFTPCVGVQAHTNTGEWCHAAGWAHPGVQGDRRSIGSL